MNSGLRRKFDEARRYLALGKPVSAAELLREVVGHQPAEREPRLYLAQAYYQGRQYASAHAELEELRRRFPSDVEVLANQAALLSEIGRQEEALECVSRALQRDPLNAGALCNLGEILKRMGNWEGAREVYATAVRSHPTHAKLRLQHALVLLALGEWHRGWAEYEHRFAYQEGGIVLEPVATPRLAPGESVSGRRVLIVHEQGLGDSLMFSRFATLLAERGAVVHLRCPESLVTLLEQLPGVASCSAPGSPLPGHDVHVPLMSLPHVLQLGPEAIAGRPYLQAPGSVPVHLADAVSRDDRLTVALCWAGNPAHADDRRRSIPSALLAPLRVLSGVRFVLLQKSPTAADLLPPDWLRDWRDLGSRCVSFTDSAHILERMDIVVTVDTALAHLAGALGRPTLLLLPFAPDFRWGLESEYSVWYAGTSLIRQSTALDWQPVVDRVYRLLSAQASPEP
jgi:hypothetical protein